MAQRAVPRRLCRVRGKENADEVGTHRIWGGDRQAGIERNDSDALLLRVGRS
jgi:hypothetical protein